MADVDGTPRGEVLGGGVVVVGEQLPRWRAGSAGQGRAASGPGGPGPPAAVWNEVIIDSRVVSSWMACTRRVENDPPSRIGSTENRIGRFESPGRTK